METLRRTISPRQMYRLGNTDDRAWQSKLQAPGRLHALEHPGSSSGALGSDFPGEAGETLFLHPWQFLAPEPTKNDEDQEGEAGPHRRMYCSRHGVMEGFQEHLLDALVHSHPPS